MAQELSQERLRSKPAWLLSEEDWQVAKEIAAQLSETETPQKRQIGRIGGCLGAERAR